MQYGNLLGSVSGFGGSGMKSTIALVDDERNILTSLGMALEAEGYKVRTYSDGAAALVALTEEPVDLAILDIKMPRMDGMELLRRLRQQTDMPVIFLTSREEEIDELSGLKMGADDYIAKPFSQRLVVERVKAVLRRFRAKDAGNAAAEAARVLERGKLRIAPERHTCRWDNHPVVLTVTEYLILQALATRPGVVKSRDALIDAAYDDQVYVDDRTIDSHIKRFAQEIQAGRRQLRCDRDALWRWLPLERIVYVLFSGRTRRGRLAPNPPGSRAAPRSIGANVRSATPAYGQNDRGADVFHAV